MRCLAQWRTSMTDGLWLLVMACLIVAFGGVAASGFEE